MLYAVTSITVDSIYSGDNPPLNAIPLPDTFENVPNTEIKAMFSCASFLTNQVLEIEKGAGENCEDIEVLVTKKTDTINLLMNFERVEPVIQDVQPATNKLGYEDLLVILPFGFVLKVKELIPSFLESIREMLATPKYLNEDKVTEILASLPVDFTASDKKQIIEVLKKYNYLV